MSEADDVVVFVDVVQELDLLSQLYSIYLPFLTFDANFRETLWSQVDLAQSRSQVGFVFNTDFQMFAYLLVIIFMC